MFGNNKNRFSHGSKFLYFKRSSHFEKRRNWRESLFDPIVSFWYTIVYAQLPSGDRCLIGSEWLSTSILYASSRWEVNALARLGRLQGRIQHSMLGGGGGGAIMKHKVFSCEHRRRETMLGGPGVCSPRFFWKKNNSAIWCVLVLSIGSILSFITFEVIFLYKKMLPLQTCQSEKKNELP